MIVNPGSPSAPRRSLLGAPGYTARLQNLEGEAAAYNGRLVWPEKLPAGRFRVKIKDPEGSRVELLLPERNFALLGQMVDVEQNNKMMTTVQSLHANLANLQQRIRSLVSQQEDGQAFVRDTFLTFDTDNSNTLDVTEFAIGIRSLGIDLSNRDASLLWPVFDQDGNGELDIDEFMELCLERGPQRRNSNTHRTILGIVAQNRTEKRRQKTALATLVCRLSVDIRKAILDRLAEDNLTSLEMFETIDHDAGGKIEKVEFFHYLMDTRSGIDMPPISAAEFNLVWPMFSTEETMTVQSWNKFLRSKECELINFTVLRDRILENLPDNVTSTLNKIKHSRRKSALSLGDDVLAPRPKTPPFLASKCSADTKRRTLTQKSQRNLLNLGGRLPSVRTAKLKTQLDLPVDADGTFRVSPTKPRKKLIRRPALDEKSRQNNTNTVLKPLTRPIVENAPLQEDNQNIRPHRHRVVYVPPPKPKMIKKPELISEKPEETIPALPVAASRKEKKKKKKHRRRKRRKLRPKKMSPFLLPNVLVETDTQQYGRAFSSKSSLRKVRRLKSATTKSRSALKVRPQRPQRPLTARRLHRPQSGHSSPLRSYLMDSYRSPIQVTEPVRPLGRVKYYHHVEYQAASKVQSLFRSRKQRQAFQEQQAGVTNIQAAVRMILAKVRVEREAAAATVLQKRVQKVVRDQKSYRDRSDAAKQIQSRLRGRQQRLTIKEQKRAATALQNRFRMHAAKGDAEERRKAAEIIQHRIQARHRGRQVRIPQAQQKVAATALQRRLRGTIVRKNKAKQIESSRKIQARIRGRSTRKEMRRQKQAAVLMQKKVRSHNTRAQVRQQRHAATRLQRLRRGTVARTRLDGERRAASKIQARIKGNRQRAHINDLRKSAKLIQDKYRNRRVENADVIEKTIMQRAERIGNTWFRVRVLDEGTSLEIQLTNRLTEAMYRVTVPLSKHDVTVEQKQAAATITIQSLVKGGMV